MVTAQILVEIPWNIAGSTLFFVCWYWTVGFASDRAGYTYLMYGIMFPLYYTTIAQAVAAMAPTADIAALLFSFFFSFVLTLYVLLWPSAGALCSLIPVVTVYCNLTVSLVGGDGCTDYRLSRISLKVFWVKVRFTRRSFVSFLIIFSSSAIGKKEIQCSPVEYVTVVPPSGMSCSQYMDPYISNFGGYLQRSMSTFACSFCPFATTDHYLAYSFNISYDHHWRNFGLMFAFIAFNVSLSSPSVKSRKAERSC